MVVAAFGTGPEVPSEALTLANLQVTRASSLCQSAPSSFRSLDVRSEVACLCKWFGEGCGQGQLSGEGDSGGPEQPAPTQPWAGTPDP